MAQRIQDLPDAGRPLKDSDMYEMQGVDIGSAKVTYKDIKDAVSADLASKVDFDTHTAFEASEGVLGHVRLENGALPVSLMPVNFDASWQVLAGSFVYFASDSNLPNTVIPCLGGTLYPDQFVDNLASLKSKIPQSWIQAGGEVKLPDLFDADLSFGGAVRNPLLGLRRSALSTSGFVPSEMPRNENRYPVITCIVTGEMNAATDHRTFYIHKGGEYTGVQITLPVVAGKVVGLSDTTKDTIEKRNQRDIANDYWNNTVGGDPLGLLTDSVQSPNVLNTTFTLDKIAEKDRTFSFYGKEFILSIEQGNLYLRSKDNANQYFALIGGQSVGNTNSWFNCGQCIVFNTNRMRISSQMIIDQSSISGYGYLEWSNLLGKGLNAVLSVRGNQILFQIGVDYNNDDRVIVPVGMWVYWTMFNNVAGDALKRVYIKDWMDKMPPYLCNNMDYYPNIPMYKQNAYDWIVDANRDAATVFYSETGTLKPLPYTQSELVDLFFADKGPFTDQWGVQASIAARTFDLSTLTDYPVIYTDGHILTFNILQDHMTIMSDTGYGIRINKAPVWDAGGLSWPQGVTPQGCGAAFKVDGTLSTNEYYLLFPDGTSIATKSNYSRTFGFWVRPSGLMMWISNVLTKDFWTALNTNCGDSAKGQDWQDHMPSIIRSTQDYNNVMSKPSWVDANNKWFFKGK